MSAYKSYKNLPSLAGVCSIAEAMQPGLSVEECVRRLKRYHYAFKRLHQIFTARITAEPIYELKMAFSLHAHLCAEQVTALRKRVGEMREPPLGLEETPHSALEQHLADTIRLVDAPSVRLCRFALLDLDDMLQFGAATLASIITQTQRQ